MLHTWSRRDWLQWGSLACLGWGSLSWPMRGAGCQPLSLTPRRARAKNCILLWLDGGPSHLEMFDPKPTAPIEVRGPFGSIATDVPGVEISELLPETSKICGEIAIVRSMTSPLGEHGLANHYLLTGYKPGLVDHPSYGAVVQQWRNDPSRVPSVPAATSFLPPYIAIPETRSGGSGFLDPSMAPFATGGDPSKENFQVRDLAPYLRIDAERLNRRELYLRELEMQLARHEQRGAMPIQIEGAIRMIQNPQSRIAFDLSKEPVAVRTKYGSRMFGQSCLLARRLVEHGVSFVMVHNTGWDTHDQLKLQLRDGFSGAKEGVGLVPTFDKGFASLITDLKERGLLDETLVVAMGEFGRTPKLNARGGRDHWPRVFSVVMAGGGVRGGQVIGASDRTGESPAETPVTPADLAFTIYSLLGVATDYELTTPDGRPIPVQQDGRWIPGIFS